MATPPTGARTSVHPATPFTGTRGRGLPNISTLAFDEDEHVPELIYPQSLRVWEQMERNTQVTALRRSLIDPLHEWQWSLDPGSMPPEFAALLCDDLDLPLYGDTTDSSGTRLHQTGWHQTLAWALKACRLGHATFEQVGRIDETGRWRIHRLNRLRHRLLTGWQVDDAGDLTEVSFANGMPVAVLPKDRVLHIQWDGQPGDPTGESLYRELYEPWLMRSRLVRVDALKHQRNGMGVPVGTIADPADGPEMDAFLAGVAAGEDTFLRLGKDQEFRLEGVTGQLPDTIESIRYHDEAMSRAWQTMVMQLGQTQTGSRALGDTFADEKTVVQGMVAQSIAEQITQQTVAAFAFWNGLELEQPAQVRVDPPQAPEPVGALPVEVNTPGTSDTQDGDLEPGLVAAAARPTIVDGVPQATRQPTEQERASGVDFAALQAAWSSVRDRLIALYGRARAAMIDAAIADLAGLPDIPAAAGDLHDLMRQAAESAIPADLPNLIAAELTLASAVAADQVVQEAARAGATIRPATDSYADQAAREARLTLNTISSTVADQIARRADEQAAPGAQAERVARAVRDDMSGLSAALLQDTAGSAASRAQHHGRTVQMQAAETDGAVREIYASELLDGRTCSPCAAVDGKRYDDTAALLVDYPSRGYRECQGGGRCRGLGVVVWESEQEVAVR